MTDYRDSQLSYKKEIHPPTLSKSLLRLLAIFKAEQLSYQRLHNEQRKILDLPKGELLSPDSVARQRLTGQHHPDSILLITTAFLLIVSIRKRGCLYQKQKEKNGESPSEAALRHCSPYS